MTNGTRSGVFEVVKAGIREILPDLTQHEFADSDRLVDLGANSMDRAEIVMFAMEALSIQVPRAQLAKAGNIGELVDVLYANSSER